MPRRIGEPPPATRGDVTLATRGAARRTQKPTARAWKRTAYASRKPSGAATRETCAPVALITRMPGNSSGNRNESRADPPAQHAPIPKVQCASDLRLISKLMFENEERFDRNAGRSHPMTLAGKGAVALRARRAPHGGAGSPSAPDASRRLERTPTRPIGRKLHFRSIGRMTRRVLEACSFGHHCARTFSRNLPERAFDFGPRCVACLRVSMAGPKPASLPVQTREAPSVAVSRRATGVVQPCSSKESLHDLPSA